MHESKYYIKKFLDLDWTKKPYIFFMIISFVLSRVPLLNLGFGSDSDSWRVAISAFDLHYFGIYHPSRFPGYPLPEFFNSLIINYGWLATNIATMILSLISVIIFAKILKELNIKNKGLIVITYAFLPILWVNSASTMDYMWALTFIMFTWFFIIRKQYALAGLIMGLAIGSRITSSLLILPFVYLILSENKRINDVIYYLIAAIMTSLILYLPLFLQYNLGFLTYQPVLMGALAIFLDVCQNFGLLAVIFALILFILSSKSLLHKVFEKDTLTLFLLFSVGIVFILYVKTPYEVAYLIPAVPFLLILLNNITKEKFFIILCILLISNSFVSFTLVDSSNITREGIITKDMAIRYTIAQTQSVLTSNMTNAVIITGEHLPSLNYFYEKLNKDQKFLLTKNGNSLGISGYENSGKNVKYVYLIPLDELKKLQKEGYKIYYMGDSTSVMTEWVYNYNLSEYNCSNLI